MTRSPEETEELGAALASLLLPGDVVALGGDLGAGKTTFVRGAARAIGVTENVASPTFVLVREYHSGQMPVYHLDVYRLERLQEVNDLGFDDLLDPRGVIFVEWGDAIEAVLPDSFCEVELRQARGETERTVTVRPSGPAWAVRRERLEAAVGAWKAA